MRTFHYHMDHLGMDIPTYPNVLRIIETDRLAQAVGRKLEGPWRDLPTNTIKCYVDNEKGLLTLPDGQLLDLRSDIVNLYVDRNREITAETSPKKPQMNHIERPRGTNWLASFYLDRSMNELCCITTSRMLYGDLYRVNLEFVSNEDTHFFCCHEEFYSANIAFLRAHFEQRWTVPYNPTMWQFPVQENLGESNEHDIVVLDSNKAKMLIVYGDGEHDVEIPFSISRFQKRMNYELDLADFHIPRATYHCPYRLSDDKLSLIFTVKPRSHFEIDVFPKFSNRMFVERFVFPTTNLHLEIEGIYERRS